MPDRRASFIYLEPGAMWVLTQGTCSYADKRWPISGLAFYISSYTVWTSRRERGKVVGAKNRLMYFLPYKHVVMDAGRWLLLASLAEETIFL